jgi:hypothetical protein
MNKRLFGLGHMIMEVFIKIILDFIVHIHTKSHQYMHLLIRPDTRGSEKGKV